MYPLLDNLQHIDSDSELYFKSQANYKSVNLKYITVGRLDNDMIVPPSDGAMFILIDWE